MARCENCGSKECCGAEMGPRIEELEAENRIFRNTESVDDSVWNALLEQVRQFQCKYEALVKACDDYYAVNGHSAGIAYVLSLLEDDDVQST